MAGSRKPAPVRRPSDAEVAATVERTRIKTIGWTTVLSFVGIAVVLLAAVPLAHAIAGKKTDFDVNVTLSLSIVFSITTTIATGFAVRYRITNRHMRHRTKDLEGDLLKAQARISDLEQELSDAQGQIQDLEEAAGS